MIRLLRYIGPKPTSTTVCSLVLAPAQGPVGWGRVVRCTYRVVTNEDFTTPQRPVVNLLETSPFNTISVHSVGPLLTAAATLLVCASIAGPVSDSLQRVASGVGVEAMLQSLDQGEYVSMGLGLLMFQSQCTLQMRVSASNAETCDRPEALVAYGSVDELLRLS